MYYEKSFYTEEERTIALQVSLTAVAQRYGYSIIKIGRFHSISEMDSIRIYNDRTYCRWSEKGHKGSGGTQIDFLMNYCGVGTIFEAIGILLDIQGITGSDIQKNYKNYIQENKETQKKKFVLPKAAANYKRLYAYLMHTRKLSFKIVDFFVKEQKILYEEEGYHNLIFLGKDKKGTVQYATKRGTIPDKVFRGDVEGNNKNYGVNIVNENSNTLKVFEACIDCMSYMDLTNDYYSNKLILGMVADNPLKQFLIDYHHISNIVFCLDIDHAGIKALMGEEFVQYDDAEAAIKKELISPKHSGLIKKYSLQGYNISVDLVPFDKNCKDWNDYIKVIKSSK